MPAKQRDEVMAGVFAVVALVLLLGIIIWLGASSFAAAPNTAVFYVEEKAGPVGLQIGSKIQFNDMAVGKVIDIVPQPKKARTLYFAEIYHEDIRIHCDGKGKVPAALVGTMPLVIVDRGSPDKPLATPETPMHISGLFQEVMSDIQAAAKNIKEVSDVVRGLITDNRDNLDEFIDNLAHTSLNLKAASEEIRRNPWRLLHKPSDKEQRSANLYDAARAFSLGAAELDQAVAKLTTLAKRHPTGLPADDPQVKRVRKRVEEAFEKFKKAEEALYKELKK